MQRLFRSQFRELICETNTALYKTLPADDHEFKVFCFLADEYPDVEREDGAGAVEYGGERGHECRQHDGQQQATCAARHQLQHQQRICDVRTSGSLAAVSVAFVRFSTSNNVC